MKRDKKEHGTGGNYRLEEYIAVASDLQSKMNTATEGGLNAPGALRVVGSKVKWVNGNNDTVRKVVDPGTFPPDRWKGTGGGA